MITDREKDQLVLDLFKGSNLNIEKSTEHVKKHPERVFYTIIGFCVQNQPKNPDFWLTTKGMAETYIKKAYMIERERFKDYKLPKYRNGKEYDETKPIAWFWSDWEKIEKGRENINEDIKDKYDLWREIIEKKPHTMPIECRIKPEYLDDAVEMFGRFRKKKLKMKTPICVSQ